MKTEFYLNDQFNELVFKNRNKQYGAYLIRREYNLTLSMVFIFVGLLFLSLFEWLNYSKPVTVVPKLTVPVVPDVEVIYSVHPIELPQKKIIEQQVKDNPQQKKINNTNPVNTKNIEVVSRPIETTFEIDHTKETISSTKGNDDPTISSTLENSGNNNNKGITSNTMGMDSDTTKKEYVAQFPEFPGGYKEMNSFILKNLKYPSSAMAEGAEGKVYISFVIEKDGSISQLSNLTPSRTDFKVEAMRVIKKMPKWKPGYDNGAPVRTILKLPIVFKLQ